MSPTPTPSIPSPPCAFVWTDPAFVREWLGNAPAEPTSALGRYFNSEVEAVAFLLGQEATFPDTGVPEAGPLTVAVLPSPDLMLGNTALPDPPDGWEARLRANGEDQGAGVHRAVPVRVKAAQLNG